MVAAGWVVLAAVFLDELLAAAAAAVWGHAVGGALLATAMVVLVVALWWGFASPKAPMDGPVLRPLTKVLVFGFASVGLWAAGHHGWAVGLLVFSIVVNALAQLPAVRGLASAEPASPH